MDEPLVSVIITTKNSSRTLEKLLKSIKGQIYKKIEVILVDNSSTDKTIEIAKKYTPKVFLKGPERSAQRNFGASKSSGQYLFFIDSDMVLGKDVVSECVKKFNLSDNLGGVIVPERSFGEGFWSKAKILEREINEGEIYFEAARFFPREIFNKFGGYNESLTGPEDWDLPQRISKKFIISRISSFIFHDEGRHTLLGLAKKKFYYGLSVHEYLKSQKMSLINQKTFYLLRPALYRHWRKIISHPITYMGMVVMLFVEMCSGALGYFVGRLKSDK